MLSTLTTLCQANNATLIAVSKTQPNQAVLEIYNAGQRHFAENKVQELVSKYEQLPKDIQWHLIGHLQTNKVKYIAPFVHCIHSIDSLKLAQAVHAAALKVNRIIPVLLQFHIAEEETKFGLSLNEAIEILEYYTASTKPLMGIEIIGVMGMASFTNNKEQVKQEFQNLQSIFNTLKHNYFMYQPSFKEISMGMSADYEIALELGSTMIRVGSLLFGQRNY
jgi:PLP dependent protein